MKIYYLLANLVASTSRNDIEKKRIILEYNLVSRTEELWVKKELTYSEECLTHMMWFFSNLIDNGTIVPERLVTKIYIQTERVLNIVSVCIDTAFP